MIYEYAGKRWEECDNCGNTISGKRPTKEDIQKHGGVGKTFGVYAECSICSQYTKERGEEK